MALGLATRDTVDRLGRSRSAASSGGAAKRKAAAMQAVREKLHQNWVPTLKVKALVSSPGSLSSALAISMRNGPNGEFQLTPMPDRNARLGAVAEELLVERRNVLPSAVFALLVRHVGGSGLIGLVVIVLAEAVQTPLTRSPW